ncbi:hypothetical protein BH20ACT3_BH20ACT3_14120 [soil metagenome]
MSDSTDQDVLGTDGAPSDVMVIGDLMVDVVTGLREPWSRSSRAPRCRHP